MLLLLVRHAETEANIAGTLQGHLDTPISARGLEQAARLAKRLESRQIDLVYSSDLRRARQTTEVIMGNRAIQIIYDQNLRERCYGELQGRHVSELDLAIKRSGLAPDRFRPPQGENYYDVDCRVTTFLDKALIEHSNKTILVVAHGGTNALLLRTFLNKPLDQPLNIDQYNTCLNELELSTSTGVRVLRLNCIEHLTAELHPSNKT